MLAQLQARLGKAVKAQEPLSEHVTFKIGGPAKYFFIAHDAQELLHACQAADQLNVPYAVLGLGSNVLVSDQGFDGLVIKLIGGQIRISDQTASCDAGANLQELVRQTTAAGLGGLEYLAGIPSSVGGAVRGNAGAFGHEIKEVVDSVQLYDQGKLETLDKEACVFAYRDSALKHRSGVLISVSLRFTPGDASQLQAAAADTLEKRKHLPTEPSAGCIFKNIELKKIPIDTERVIKALDVSEEEFAQATRYGKLPVGFILDHLNYRGKKRGGVQISEKHCAYFINTGDAHAEEVIILISEIKMKVRNELGIQLQEEVQYLGF